MDYAFVILRKKIFLQIKPTWNIQRILLILSNVRLIHRFFKRLDRKKEYQDVYGRRVY